MSKLTVLSSTPRKNLASRIEQKRQHIDKTLKNEILPWKSNSGYVGQRRIVFLCSPAHLQSKQHCGTPHKQPAHAPHGKNSWEASFHALSKLVAVNPTMFFFLAKKWGRDQRWLVHFWREPLPLARKGTVSPEKITTDDTPTNTDQAHASESFTFFNE
jgi:hypothetical protein